MKLASAQSGQVVRNQNNGSHYRFERIEKGKARIFPLELFPNGLLVAKPTPTSVELDLDVLLVGVWTEAMVVDGKPTKSRKVYENELVRLEQQRGELAIAYAALPRGGKGKLSRGSWANKIKAVEHRVGVLKLGLGFIDAVPIHTDSMAKPDLDFTNGQLVQVPSGRPAKILGFQAMGDQTYARIRTMFEGSAVVASLPTEVLRDWTCARLCTV